MAKWYYSVGDRAQGPVDDAVILENIKSNQLTLVDLVYREGDKAWRTLGEVPEFKSAFVQHKAPDAEPALPPEIESDGPFRFESGVNLTWVLLQKKAGAGGDKYTQSGPYSAEQLEQMLTARTCQYADYVWRPGYKRWTRLGNLPEFDRRRKNRDGDETPELVPLPDVDMSLPPASSELLANVVQAVPPSLSSLTVPQEFKPQEAAGEDLTDETASQFDLRTMEKPEVMPGPKEIHLRGAPSVAPPPLAEVSDDEEVPKVPDYSVTAKIKMPIADANTDSDADADATVVQNLSKPETLEEIDGENGDDTGNQIALEELPPKRWVKPAAIASGAVAFAAIGLIVVQTFVPGLSIPGFGEESEDVVAKVKEVEKPVRPITRDELMSPPPVAKPVVERPVKPTVSEPMVPVPAKTEQVAVAPQPQPALQVQPAIKLPVKAVQAGTKVTVAEIVPVKTDLQRPQFAVNTDAPVGATIWFSVSARSGDVLKYPSFYKSTSTTRAPGQVPSFDLSSWKLPAGQYRVDAMVGDIRTFKMVFIGKKDRQFNSEIEKHLKYLSYQQQEEKKALFKATRDLEKLSQSLGDSYFRLRTDARKWRAFYIDWQKRVKRSKQGIVDRMSVERRNELTYPDEILAVKTASIRLVDQARTLNDSIMSNTPARDVASVNQLAIVKEFAKLRTMVSQISSRR